MIGNLCGPADELKCILSGPRTQSTAASASFAWAGQIEPLPAAAGKRLFNAMTIKFGDRLVHAGRPEWGIGIVTAVQNVVEGGRAGQRVTLRFDRAGLKVLNTLHADLRPAEDHPSSEAAGITANGEPGWLSQLEAGDLNERMSRLPEATRDPFATLASRIKATLDLWRFSDQGGALLDWAAMQTGLKDPLVRFSRHELEQFFKRFATERESHLKRLLLEAKRHPSPEIEQVKTEASPAAREAMRRLHL